MSLDELGRSTGRRTTQSVAATTDAIVALRDLDRLRRRRTNFSVGAVATGVVLAVGIWFGASGLPFHRAAPATPRPITPVKPFKAAPPLCGPDNIAAAYGLDKYVDSATCGTGPGRYLSLDGRHIVFNPLVFTLPDGWIVEGIQARSGHEVRPNGGLLLRSERTGSAVAITVYPLPADDPTDRLVTALSPQQIADRVGHDPSLVTTRLLAQTMDGYPTYGYDVRLPAGARPADSCLVGNGCHAVYRVWSDPPPDLGLFGVVQGRPSRVLSFAHGSLPVLVWMWGPSGAASVDEDDELTGIVRSIKLNWPGVVVQIPTPTP